MHFYAAANPDVKPGVSTMVHFDQNIPATYKLQEAMRRQGAESLRLPPLPSSTGKQKLWQP
ncbi:MAG: hypothetical protein AB3K77_11555 [Methanosarcinaceae archaeon]